MFLKRLLDLIGAAAGMVLAAPLMLIIAIAIKATSTGPVFYRQKRVGCNGVRFDILKFRSMRTDAEANTGAVWAKEKKGQADPRVTPVGNFLRKSHLDELPQLWLVLKGTMSLVGPRPERPEFVKPLSRDIAYYKERIINMKPGVTGLAQMSSEADEGRNTMDSKLISDHAYGIFLCHANIFTVWWLDSKILLLTILHIFLRPKANVNR